MVKILGRLIGKEEAFKETISPLLFVLSMIPLSLVLRKVNVCHEWGKKEYKPNHMLFMDDLKLFSKIEEQIETFVKTFMSLLQILGWSLG